jgi:hemerythrin superfamily protein
MDALMLLTADHNRVRGLFARFQAAQEADKTDAMATLFQEIDHELEVHTDIEETVFYPWAHDLSGDIGEVVDEGIEEHHVVKVLQEEIRQLPAGDDTWTAKVSVLIENVEHHASEEEQQMFPQIRSAARGNQLQDLAERLEARKRELGAPTMADKEYLTKEELQRLASDQEIPGRSSMDREELAATVALS